MKSWFVKLLIGLVAIALGILALVNPFAASMGIERIVSFAFLVIGAATVLSALYGEQEGSRTWTTMLGGAMILIGAFLFMNPEGGLRAITWIFGGLAAIAGIFKLVAGLRVKIPELRWILVISGLLSLLVAVLVFNNPFSSLGILLGLQLILDGAGLAALGLVSRAALKAS